MNEIIEDFGTKEKVTTGNPSGMVLSKFNAERATRRFLQTALPMSAARLDQYMSENYKTAWAKYDVNGTGFIDKDMCHQYFRSLIQDNTYTFGLREQDHFEAALKGR